MSYHKGIPNDLDISMQVISNVARTFAVVNPISLWEASFNMAATGIADDPMLKAIKTCGEGAVETNTATVLAAAAVIANPIHDGKYAKPCYHLHYLHCGTKWDAPMRGAFRHGEFKSLSAIWEMYSKAHQGSNKLAFYLAMEEVFGNAWASIEGRPVDAGYFLTVVANV